MLRKAIVSTIVLGALAASAPALAGGWGGSSGCRFCGSTSGGWNPPSSSSSSSSTSGGSSSGGTQVPEPGMLGMAGAGLIGLAMIRQRRRKLTKK
ncbi:MAG TPA: PEP-CTERM sorting domain-containing protein [Sphingomonadaceae bacterium]|nr:PEP-CTERM sorting domain-containing protein [Sphingomonadaceae bacterium]